MLEEIYKRIEQARAAGNPCKDINDYLKFLTSAEYHAMVMACAVPATPAPAQTAPGDAPTAGAWPAPVDARAALDHPHARPPDLIEGLCFTQSKIYMAGPSKSHKTFMQMYLALAIATGRDWLGWKVMQGRALYLNFELRPYTFEARTRAILQHMDAELAPDALTVWHLRGCAVDLARLRREFEAQIAGDFDLIIIDPTYKLLGGDDLDENKSKDLAKLYNALECLALERRSSVACSTHYAKGGVAGKDVLDRSVGSNVTGRDADLYMTISETDQVDGWALDLVTRDHPPVERMGVRWRYPVYVRDEKIDPTALKKPGAAQRQQIDPDMLLASFLAELRPDWLKRQTVIQRWRRKTGQPQSVADAEFDVALGAYCDLPAGLESKNYGKFEVRRDGRDVLLRATG